jgi:WD40 repeat protein
MATFTRICTHICFVAAVVLAFARFYSYAQDAQTSSNLPNTDVFLVDITLNFTPNGAKAKFGTPINITNRAGYDNQPSFTPDGNFILYTSIREDRQADIYRYSIREKMSARVTTTPESEYSPSVTPDGKYISVVRVEKDSTQRLWKFDLRGSTPELVLPNVRPVGYYAWMDATNVLLYILGVGGSQSMLQVANTVTGQAQLIASNVGRCLQKVPGQKKPIGSFVTKMTEEQWTINSLDPVTRGMGTLTDTMLGSEDYTWTPQASLLMAQGTKLYHRIIAGRNDTKRTAKNAATFEWQEIADFSTLAGVKALKRLALSPDGKKLVFVAEVQ